MAPRSKAGVSTYLELFLLLGVATGGSALVYSTTQKYAASAQGPAISVSGATIRQGSNVAVERITASNTGTTSFSSFSISTPSISSSAAYCYSLNPSTGPPSSTCPTMSANPSQVTVAVSVPPGGSVTLELTIPGGSVFAVGSTYTLIIVSSNTALTSLQVVALPA